MNVVIYLIEWHVALFLTQILQWTCPSIISCSNRAIVVVATLFIDLTVMAAMLAAPAASQLHIFYHEEANNAV